MRKFLQRKGFIVYEVVLLAEILSHALSIPWAHYITKPLLMPVLLLWLWSIEAREKNKPRFYQLRKVLMWGLAFAWLGDILLLFAGDNLLLFAGGLTAFLTTHVLYIYFFKAAGATPLAQLSRYLPLVIGMAMYVAGLLGILWPYLGALAPAVVVYALVIGCMGYVAYSTKNLFTPAVYNLFVWGAMLFIVSDSLLAYNKFHTALPAASIWIMVSYGLAQGFIARGFVQGYTAAQSIDAASTPGV